MDIIIICSEEHGEGPTGETLELSERKEKRPANLICTYETQGFWHCPSRHRGRGGGCNPPSFFSEMAVEALNGLRWNFAELMRISLRDFWKNITGSGQVTEL